MKIRALMLGVPAVLFISGLAWAGLRPFTLAPEIIEVEEDEECVMTPGRLKCRWDGECVKIGNACYSCLSEMKWSSGMNACYKCTAGTSLELTENNEWECN